MNEERTSFSPSGSTSSFFLALESLGTSVFLVALLALASTPHSPPSFSLRVSTEAAAHPPLLPVEQDEKQAFVRLPGILRRQCLPSLLSTLHTVDAPLVYPRSTWFGSSFTTLLKQTGSTRLTLGLQLGRRAWQRGLPQQVFAGKRVNEYLLSLF